MLFRADVLHGIADGRVTLAFRRWRRTPPAEGATLRTPIGVLRIEHVSTVDEGDITAADIRQTGLSPAELRASLAGTVHRMIDTDLAEERSRRLARARSLPTRLMIPVTLLMLPGAVLLGYAPSLIAVFDDLVGGLP